MCGGSNDGGGGLALRPRAKTSDLQGWVSGRRFELQIMLDFLAESPIPVHIDPVDDVFLGVEVWHVHIISEFSPVHDYGVMLPTSNKGDI